MTQRLRLPDAAMRRNGLVLGAALVGHMAVFALLALRAIEAPFVAVSPPPLYLDIEPRPLLEGERPRTPLVQVPTETRIRAGGALSAAAPLPLRDPLDEDEEDALTDPAITLPLAAAQGVEPAWRVAPESDADRTARAMRAAGFGCHPATRRLTAEEQASCDRRLAAAAGAPIRGTGDPARDRAFAAQGAAAIARYEAQRAPLSGGSGNAGPADCVGSNLGIGCAGAHLDPALRQGGDSLTRQQSNKMNPIRPLAGGD